MDTPKADRESKGSGRAYRGPYLLESGLVLEVGPARRKTPRLGVDVEAAVHTALVVRQLLCKSAVMSPQERSSESEATFVAPRMASWSGAHLREPDAHLLSPYPWPTRTHRPQSLGDLRTCNGSRKLESMVSMLPMLQRSSRARHASSPAFPPDDVDIRIHSGRFPSSARTPASVFAAWD